jgi:hypothetical protein
LCGTNVFCACVYRIQAISRPRICEILEDVRAENARLKRTLERVERGTQFARHSNYSKF